MREPLEAHPVRNRASGDSYARQQAEAVAESSRELASVNRHNLDGPVALKTLRRLLEWFYFEREKQAANRMEMAMDADFYDNMQWNPEDAQALRERGQMPLVFNEVAPMVDWIIGTERRTRVDWKILPRTEDDVKSADVKTKLMKYVSDVNRVTFNRSRAFSDAIKAGVGWVDDGVRDDPTQEILYNKYEDWRNVLWDSASYELDLSDARYLFRSRWVDEDIAVAMFPDRADKIRMGVQEAQHYSTSDWEEDTWYTAEELLSGSKNGVLRASGSGIMIDAKRRRVRLIECQWREPVQSKIVADGPMKGSFLNMKDRVMLEALARQSSSIIDKVVMRVHVAVFTETSMISMTTSPFRHNMFSLTPTWCYRRGRDRQPYGVIRRVRDIQQDLNKRASKALFMLNTNQIIADEGAVDDWNKLREEADRPDGMIVKKQGKELKIQRDTDAATGQIQMMTLDAQSIQKSAGVTQENLGRQTNAVSGKAIEARQLQGGVVTTEPFDNHRLATQVSGEKQLSLTEQFYTEEKVVRLTGAKGAIEWVKVNAPEMQPDGSVRFLNDISASMADFIVSEADYAGTMRQFMFESLNQLAARLDPQVAMRIMTIAMEFSDLPNKNEVAEQFRKITGERDPNKELTPEELQAEEEQAAMQSEALQLQRQSAMAALEEQQAKVAKLMAEARKVEAEAAALGAGGDDMAGAVEGAVQKIRQETDRQMADLADKLRTAQAELGNRTMQITADKDAKLEAARIEADSRVRMAEIQAASDKAIERVMKTVDGMRTAVDERLRKAETDAREREAKKPVPAPAPAPAPVPAPAPAPAVQPINLTVQVDGGSKTIKIERDASGNLTGQVKPSTDSKPTTKDDK